MDLQLKHRFQMLWKGFFPHEALPIVFFHTDDPGDADPVNEIDGQECVLGHISRVRAGYAMYFESGTVSCNGARLYFGFGNTLEPFQDTFPTCGMAGKISGERVVMSNSEIAALGSTYPALPQKGRFLVCKPWMTLHEDEIPEVVAFFPQNDALSGLMALVHGPDTAPDMVASLYCSGCASLVYHPCRAEAEQSAKAYIGMLDLKARHFMEGTAVSFSLPWHAFMEMVGRMEDNVMISDVWKPTRERMRNRNRHRG